MGRFPSLVQHQAAFRVIRIKLLPIYAKMKKLIKYSGLLLFMLLPACSPSYHRRTLDVGTGQVFATNNNGKYRFDGAWGHGIVISSIDHPDIRQGWKLERGSYLKPIRHSLGNNESLRILDLSRNERSARIELSHLSKVAPGTLPP